MRALIQRVSKASVNISGNRHSAIKNGLLIFTCWENDDDFSDSDWSGWGVSHFESSDRIEF